MYIAYSSMFARAISHATADILLPKGERASRDPTHRRQARTSITRRHSHVSPHGNDASRDDNRHSHTACDGHSHPVTARDVLLPASAQQINVGIGFDNFHNELAPYGTWSNHARWGEVWHPRADRDFRPYYNGHWEDTREYGWLWVSDDRWGDVPYHYGRWVFDPREGWLWVPGYVWAPSWVVWREGGGNIGWFPMPPGDDYYGDGPYRDNFANQYGYRDWYGPSFGNEQFLSLWIFVGQDHFRDRNFRNYAVPQRDYGNFFSQTTNTTNYVTINNYVVNRSVDETASSGRPVSGWSRCRRVA